MARRLLSGRDALHVRPADRQLPAFAQLTASTASAVAAFPVAVAAARAAASEDAASTSVIA